MNAPPIVLSPSVAPGDDTSDRGIRWAWLPSIGSWRYHALLVVVGMFVLGPLGGITAAYMNFSLGFFVSGQVLAGILGSIVTLGYGSLGRHGANYIQTVAASVAGMSAMGVLVQALVWLGLPQPPLIPLMLYMLCIGMFGAGVGMMYTPLLIDRLQLPFPSGLAVANILRALTDPVLLRRAAAKLVGGIALGTGGSVASASVKLLEPLGLSMSTLGAGMVVGSRLAVPALVGSLVFTALMPWFISIGWLQEGDPYRKIAFLLALGGLLGAVLVDLLAIGWTAARHWRQQRAAGQARQTPDPDQALSTTSLGAWIVFWGVGTVLVGHGLLGQPVKFLLIAIALVFVFALINGVATGISDQTPISAAFVISVLIMASAGLRSPSIGLMAGAILFIGTQVASDMQQDRSTGWRLGSSRRLQFAYQVSGILLGAVAAIGFAALFMGAYPVLRLDQTSMSAVDQPSKWASAMTYKFVGTLRSLADDGGYKNDAMRAGALIGFVAQLLRRIVRSVPAYRRMPEFGRVGFAAEWVCDTVVLPSPYAFGFGGFVNVLTAAWFAAGGVVASVLAPSSRRAGGDNAPGLPDDMSTASLIGGGLIAGEGLAALGIGIWGLLTTVL